METAKAFKRRMLLWTNSWFNEELETTEAAQFTPSATDIACLLQAVGFRVRLSEKCLPTGIPEVSTECNACRVILICPHSGRRIELDAPKTSCRGQSSNSSNGHGEDVNETTAKPVEEGVTSASLMPSLEISKTMSQLLEGILRIMSTFPELSNNNNMEEVNGEASTAVQRQESLTPTSNCSSLMNTPAATGIAVVTPNAPRIAKPSAGEDGKSVPPGRYRSLDTLIASGSGFSDELPEPGQLTPKDDRDYGLEMDIDDDGDLNATIVQGPGSANKKFISKSSPAFHRIEKFQRSGTFVFENEKEDSITRKGDQPMLLRSNTFVSDNLTTNAKDEPRSGPPPQKTLSPLIPKFSQSLIVSKLQDVRNAVSDIIFMFAGDESTSSDIEKISKALNDVAAEAAQQDKTADARPIRCLSDFGGVSNLSRVASKVRSIPRPTLRKRSTTIACQVTPTTSRREATGSPGDERKKSASTTALSSNRVGQIPSSRLHKISTTPSSIPGASGLKSKGTISSASAIRTSLTPNRKCANVQSSASKSGVIRK